jgi:3-methyl-2-oxobutanoate hydroxymethyltransferase
MLGLNEGFKAKFLKRYAEMAETVRSAVRWYADDVRNGHYPNDSHTYDK